MQLLPTPNCKIKGWQACAANKLENVSTVNSAMLRFAIKRGKWPADLVKSIMGLVTMQVKKTVSLVKK